jgi:hypothetical protein
MNFVTLDNGMRMCVKEQELETESKGVKGGSGKGTTRIFPKYYIWGMPF